MSENSNSPDDLQEPQPDNAPDKQSIAQDSENELVEKTSTDSERLKREFRVGFLASLIINGIAVGCYWFYIGLANIEGSWNWQPVWQFGSIWLLVNIIILASLAVLKRNIFQGVVAGLALALFINFVSGIFLTYVCYSAFV